MAFAIFQNVEKTTIVVVLATFVSETIPVAHFVIRAKNVKSDRNVEMGFVEYLAQNPMIANMTKYVTFIMREEYVFRADVARFSRNVSEIVQFVNIYSSPIQGNSTARHQDLASLVMIAGSMKPAKDMHVSRLRVARKIEIVQVEDAYSGIICANESSNVLRLKIVKKTSFVMIGISV